MNTGREYLRRLKQIQKSNGDVKLTQEEIDILFESLKRKDELKIKRKPWIGCFISVVGTILFWSLIWWIWVSL